MAIEPITPLPAAPSRADDSTTFSNKADAFVAAMVSFVTEMNNAIAEIPEIAMAINYNTSSTSSVLIGTGNKTFTVPVDGLLQVGHFVIAASAANPSNYMAGQVTSHNTTTGELIVDVNSVGGSGTFADWVIAPTVVGDISSLSAVAFSGSGADLAADSVAFSKLPNATAASKLVGRGAGAGGGDFGEISLGTNLSMTGNTLNVSSGTATLGDGDYGDVIASSSGTILTIDNNVVTFAKMQDLSANVLIGSSSAGDPVEISCTAAGRAILDDADASAQRTTLGLGSIATLAEMTTAQYWANTADKAVSTDQLWAAAAYVTLTQAVTIAVDFGAGINFTTTMTGNRTLGNPSNSKTGQSGCIEIKQDATGNRTLAYGTSWEFAGGTTPTLTTTANKRDLLFYQVLPDGKIYGNLVKDVPTT